ncbi:TatD family hydrolase [Thiocystis violacea]|uniref:TatD family hydrolase n=1 Tax=Thiocystis violacea TaxID=13725 RepID=UPI0019088877|nr:TatD family hydrolase [Thiocystis violacea]MBK1717959.1 DNAase [Thiocystis violacea]
MDLIDTHCHLDVAEFDADRDAVLAGTRATGVAALVVPAIHAEGWPGLLALCLAAPVEGPRLYSSLGLHPVYLDRHRDEDLSALERLLAEHHPVAIGEIGLDYHVGDLDPRGQQRLFERQLAIAREARLPVLLHVRKAHDQVLYTLRRIPVRGGIAHAFNGSQEQGRHYLDLGFKLGFGGMLTFERSSKLRRLATQLPLEGLVLETDAPDMTVAAHQGERNSPEYLPDVLTTLARIRDLDPTEVASRTTANAREVLSLA